MALENGRIWRMVNLLAKDAKTTPCLVETPK
jgi:hypothetical protein